MEKTTTVSEFVKKYEATTEKMKPTLLKEIKSEKYISYMEKCIQMDRIVQSTNYDKNKDFHINSPMKFVLFTISIIEMYTNLKINEDDIINEFDELNRVGLIDAIIYPTNGSGEVIPVKEIEECGELLSMLQSDFIENNCNMKFEIIKYLNNLNIDLNEVIKQINWKDMIK